jgi:hypothetical protein
MRNKKCLRYVLNHSNLEVVELKKTLWDSLTKILVKVPGFFFTNSQERGPVK